MDPQITKESAFLPIGWRDYAGGAIREARRGYRSEGAPPPELENMTDLNSFLLDKTFIAISNRKVDFMGTFSRFFGRRSKGTDTRRTAKRRGPKRATLIGYRGNSSWIELLEDRSLMSGNPAWADAVLAGPAAPGDVFSAVQTAPGEMRLQFSLGDYSLLDQADGTQRILAPGLMMAGEGGNPDLPGRLFRLALPGDTDLSSVSLIDQSSLMEMVPGNIRLGAVPLAAAMVGEDIVLATGGNEIVDGRNTLVYNRDAYFGSPVCSIVSTQQMGRWKIAEVYYNPFQYNPVTGSLRVTDQATLSLRYQSGDPLPAALARDTAWDAQASEIVANFGEASLWYAADTASLLPSSVTTGSGSASPAPTSTLCDYLIITTSAIQAGSTQLENFVAHQEARGFSVEVMTETAWGGGTGDAAAENIRNYLQSVYDTLGVRYVLLVGNPNPATGNVPMKMTYPRATATSDNTAPTDYYYAELTDNWDSDGDGKFGEWGAGHDFTSKPLAEVTVGRIPVYGTDYASLDGILAKSIAYEDDLNPEWRRSMLLPMAISNYANQGNSGWPRTDGTSLANYIKSDLATPRGYSTYTMFEKAGLTPVTQACDAPLTNANLVGRWSSTPYGIVDWWGHGDTTGAYRFTWNSDSNGNGYADDSETSFTPFMQSGNTTALDDSHPSMVVQISCLNGLPESSTNLGYALLKHGAVATYSGSRVTWYAIGDWAPSVGVSVGDNASYAYQITRQLTDTSSGATTGAALQWTRENLGTGWEGESWMNALTINLYGDPSAYLFSPAEIHGSVVNDANGNHARDAGESGVSGWTVFVDENNNGLLDSGTATAASGNVNLAINDQQTVTSSQVVSGVVGKVTDVNVTLNISHTFDADLSIVLVSPSGAEVTLVASAGGEGNNFTATVLDDEAAMPIDRGTPPFTGSFRPSQPLSVFDGETASGTWQLRVTDAYSGDTGTLLNWTLTLSTAEQSTTTAADGRYSFRELAAGTYNVRHLPQAGWTDVEPASGKQVVTLLDGQIANHVDFLVNANAPPVANDDAYSMQRNTVLSVAAAGVLANDSDSEGNPLAAVLVTGPSHGTLSLAADGSFTYTPGVNYWGTDSFTYKANDGHGDSNTATVSITIARINAAPAGADISVTTPEDTPYTFLVGDFGFSDPNDSPADLFSRVRITTLPSAGVLTCGGTAVTAGQFVTVADLAAGNLVFHPGANLFGAPYAAFTFQVEDGGGTAGGGVNLDPTPNTLLVTVTAINDPPVRTAGTVADLLLAEDSGAASLGLEGLAYGPGGGADEASQTLVYRVTQVPVSGLGSIVLGDGTTVVTASTVYSLAEIRDLRFITASHAVGSGTFAFTVTDAGGAMLIESMTIGVFGENHAPTAVDDYISVRGGESVTFDVLANDADDDGGCLSFTVCSQPAHGVLYYAGGSSLTYVSTDATCGSDSFTYLLDDGQGGVDTATVWITVENPTSMSTPGLYDPTDSRFFLKNSFSGGDADVMFNYGVGGLGWIPLAGDWDGDSQVTVGLYDPATSVFFLKDSHGGGDADYVFAFGVGGHGWQPIVGDWNGDGIDTIGLYEPASGIFFLRNSHAGGDADVMFAYGVGGQGWQPLSGDWDGDGNDTVGLYCPNQGVFFLRNQLQGGPADVAFAYGIGGQGWMPLTGNWGQRSGDSIGLYEPQTGLFFLKHELAGGDADICFAYGMGGMNWKPMAGDWLGQSASGLAPRGSLPAGSSTRTGDLQQRQAAAVVLQQQPSPHLAVSDALFANGGWGDTGGWDSWEHAMGGRGRRTRG